MSWFAITLLLEKDNLTSTLTLALVPGIQNMIEVSEKEFAVIQEIHKNEMPDQRMIAHKTGISLGMTNMIIQRLIERGYI